MPVTLTAAGTVTAFRSNILVIMVMLSIIVPAVDILMILPSGSKAGATVPVTVP